jgi:hypothetical protein
VPLSWNEIRHNAIRFSREWCAASRENADKQTFWNEFFTPVPLILGGGRKKGNL